MQSNKGTVRSLQKQMRSIWTVDRMVENVTFIIHRSEGKLTFLGRECLKMKYYNIVTFQFVEMKIIGILCKKFGQSNCIHFFQNSNLGDETAQNFQCQTLLYQNLKYISSQQKNLPLYVC